MKERHMKNKMSFQCFHLIFRKYYLSCVLYTSPWHREVCLLVAAPGCASLLLLGVENSGPVPLFLFPKPWVLWLKCYSHTVSWSSHSLPCRVSGSFSRRCNLQPNASNLLNVPLSTPPNLGFTLYFWILWLTLPSHTLWIYTPTQVTTTQIKIYTIYNSLEGSFVPPSSQYTSLNNSHSLN